MAERRRTDKLNSEFKKLISMSLAELDLLSNISILDVSVTEDLDRAKVFVSIFGTDDKQKMLEVLKSKSGAIRHFLSTKMSIRKIPQLFFEIDNTEVVSSRIDALLKQISQEKKDNG